MATRVVTDPAGVVWRVRRRWIPHSEGRGLKARLRKRKQQQPVAGTTTPAKKKRGEWIDVPDLIPDVDSIAALVIGIVVVVVVVLLVAFGPGLFLLGIDLAWLAVVFVAGLFAHVVLRRPWLVEAVPSGGDRRQFAVQGFRAAGRARDDIAGSLSAGLRV